MRNMGNNLNCEIQMEVDIFEAHPQVYNTQYASRRKTNN